MAANKSISEIVVVLPYKYYGKEGCTDIVEAVPCEDDKGAKKSISDMDAELVHSEDGTNKAIGEMYKDAVTSEEGSKKTRSEKTVEAFHSE